MKKIIVITNGTLPVPATKGGAVENLLQIFLLKNEDKHNFDVTVFTIFDEKAQDITKDYIYTNFIFINSDTILYKLGRAFRFLLNKVFSKPIVGNQFIYEVLKNKDIFSKFDMVLIENNPSFARFIKNAIDIPTVLHLHNDYINVDNEKLSFSYLQHLDYIIPVSKYIKNRILDVKEISDKVKVVYNGIDIDRFNNKNLIDEYKTSYHINDNDIVILFTGRLQETKGIGLLVGSFIELSYMYKNIKLIVVGGSGFGNSNETTFTNKLKILSQNIDKNKIIFTGYVNYSEIQYYYHLSDFAVFPSLETEAFGLTSIEALASGLPVIITDSGGMPETVNNKCGIIVRRGNNVKKDLKSAMETLIINKNLRETMSLAAIEHSKTFSIDKYCNTLSSVINSFLISTGQKT